MSLKRVRSALVQTENLGPVNGLEDLSDGLKVLCGDQRELMNDLENIKVRIEATGRDVDAAYNMAEDLQTRADCTDGTLNDLEAKVARCDLAIAAMQRLLEEIGRKVELLMRRVPADPEPTPMPASQHVPESHGSPRDVVGLLCSDCGESWNGCVCEYDPDPCDGCGGAHDVCRCEYGMSQAAEMECPSYVPS